MKQDEMYNLIKKSQERETYFKKSSKHNIFADDQIFTMRVDKKGDFKVRSIVDDNIFLASLKIANLMNNQVEEATTVLQKNIKELYPIMMDAVNETGFWSGIFEMAIPAEGMEAKPILKGNANDFSFVLGTASNVEALINEDSAFKKRLAAIDLASNTAAFTVGKAALKAPLLLPVALKLGKVAAITSVANYAGAKLYDAMPSRYQEKLDYFASDFLKDAMNNATEKQVERIEKQLDEPGARIGNNRIVNNRNTNERAQARRKMIEEGITIEGPITMMKDALNKVTEKQMDRIQEQLSNSDARIVGNRIVTKSNIHERSQKGKNQNKNTTVLDLYNPTTTDRDKVYASRHGELVSKQPNSKQTNHSVNNNNSFVINVTGAKKSTNEIINELVPKLKYSLANMSLGAL